MSMTRVNDADICKIENNGFIQVVIYQHFSNFYLFLVLDSRTQELTFPAMPRCQFVMVKRVVKSRVKCQYKKLVFLILHWAVSAVAVPEDVPECHLFNRVFNWAYKTNLCQLCLNSNWFLEIFLRFVYKSKKLP